MFNGVGLTTARGSGTSGYVQKSLAYYKQREKNNNYREVLNKFKENPAPERSSINEDILKHDVLYKIEAELYKLKKKYETKYEETEMKEFLGRKRKELEKEYSRKVIDDTDNKNINSHKYNFLIEKKNEKLKNAFGIKDSHVTGEAFDIELQEEKRKVEKQERKKQIKEREKDKIKALKKAEKEKLRLERKEKELKLLRELEAQYPELNDS